MKQTLSNPFLRALDTFLEGRTGGWIINIVVILQIFTIIVSRGDVTFLANLYAFGVIWSFTFNCQKILRLQHQVSF